MTKAAVAEATRTFTVEARRSGAWWAIRVPSVEGAFSQAKRLDQVEDMARDAVATMLDVPASSFDIDVQVQLTPPAEDALRRLGKARQELQDAQAAFSEAARAAAMALVAQMGVSVRDAGRILGVSHQRVDQLLHNR